MSWAKALAGAIAAGLLAAVPLVVDGLTLAEVLAILGAALGTGATVWRVPNTEAVPDVVQDPL